MARPTLFRHRKFSRLVRILGSEALALGHLELLWSAAYEAGEEIVGDSPDVEYAAKWTGEPGKLTESLTQCGFLDSTENGFVIHDLWDHAPEYVRKRRARELERRTKGAKLRRSADSVQSVSGQESVHRSATIPDTSAVVDPEAEQTTFREGVGAPVVTLLCVGTGRSEFTVRESLAAEWGEAYPGVDVPVELRKAVQWCADNPTRRKTFRGARKFLSGWLARAQNTLPSKGNGRAQPIAAASSGCPEWDRILGAYHVRSPETEAQLSQAVTAAVEGGILRLTVPDEYRAQYVERHIADIRASSPIPVLIAVQPAEFAVPGEDLPF
jgi:hypothetical protein